MMLYTAKGLTRKANGRTILDIDHLEMEKGNIYGLLGANGAGKTTLLHILAFLERPASGAMTFQNQQVRFDEKNMQILRRQVVMLDQYPILFSTTVKQNLEFGLKLRKISRNRRERIIDEALDLVDMRSFKEAPAKTLSGGETQRIALARALALDPQVFLCDEPTASVDLENQATIVGLLKRINSEQDITIVFTTHDRQLAAHLAHRTLVLNRGRLSEFGYDNLLSCTIHHLAGDQLQCQVNGSLSLTLPAAGAKHLTGKQRLWIDPARITLRAVGAEKESPCITGRLTQLAMEATRIRATIDIGLPITVLLRPAEYQELRPTIGETMAIEIDNKAVHIL